MKSVTDLINDEIARRGAMPFAEFMELALYAPGLGYYERHLKQIGRNGDFYTSVSAGPFFGELLSFQFARWLAPLAGSGPLQIVESGAHDGQLAEDILKGLERHAPALLRQVEYRIVEPSKVRRAAQEARLGKTPQVTWTDELTSAEPVRGIIFSNELLDAMAVHPFAWNARERRWDERGVGRSGSRFTYVPLPEPTVPPPKLPEALLDVLPDGYVFETAPAAVNWWKNAADVLNAGILMTIDYGGTLEELLNPGRNHGTVRAYSKHGITDPLSAPGDHDITGHVNFTAVREAGEARGLMTKTFTSQSQFLTEISRELWLQTRAWPQESVRQFQTLTHPEHLGRPFRVLTQERL